jgi:hypothetical protein
MRTSRTIPPPRAVMRARKMMPTKSKFRDRAIIDPIIP